ncbi:MAG: outer membrane protein assembly factor BamD [Bacteroidales bacterium]|nr:outer membrane protein assembly factor BamD [Bacteroidales bacterium]
MFKKLAILSSIVLVISACSKYQKLLKSSDYEQKYKMGVMYYEKGDYTRAYNLLEELHGIYKGTQRAEKVYYYLAGSHFGKKEYILAGYHYGMFARTYPQSEYAEEALYKSAYCAYLNASPSSLDMSFTVEGIKALQLFIDKYPKSNYVTECNSLIDELRGRLEVKAFANAKLYYNLGDYKAAGIALKNVLIEYPDTKYREEILYLILKSAFVLAEKSVESKKNERYQKAIDEYYILADEFPESEKIKEAERLFNKSRKYLKQQ